MSASTIQTRRTLIAGGVILVIAAVVGTWLVLANNTEKTGQAIAPPSGTAAPLTQVTVTETVTITPSVPDAGVPDAGAPTACSYPPDGSPADVLPPAETNPATEGFESMTLTTNKGVVTIQLDRAAAPCTVNSMISLADQGYFDGTICHRLTSSPSLEVLQCGDPTGTGGGGPGYSFDDENLGGATYSAGTVAMANAGPATNGSQFFLVYGAAQLPPSYTVFGSMDPASLAVVKEIAAAGTVDGGTDGAPASEVLIESAVIAKG